MELTALPEPLHAATAMAKRPSKLVRGIAYRLYLLTMRGESHAWLPLRRWLLNTLLGRKHDRLNVFANVFIEGIEGLALGDNVSINRDCNISAFGGLRIGNDVSIAHSTSILTGEHRFSDSAVPIKQQPVLQSPVLIGDNIWVGARVCILAGVTLAPGTIVGAGAVVKQSVTEQNCTIAGVPAKIVKRRN